MNKKKKSALLRLRCVSSSSGVLIQIQISGFPSYNSTCEGLLKMFAAIWANPHVPDPFLVHAFHVFRVDRAWFGVTVLECLQDGRRVNWLPYTRKTHAVGFFLFLFLKKKVFFPLTIPFIAVRYKAARSVTLPRSFLSTLVWLKTARVGKGKKKKKKNTPVWSPWQPYLRAATSHRGVEAVCAALWARGHPYVSVGFRPEQLSRTNTTKMKENASGAHAESFQGFRNV